MVILASVLAMVAVALPMSGHSQHKRLMAVMPGANAPTTTRRRTADRLDLERLRGWAAPMAGVAVLLLLPWPLAPAAALAIVVALGVALPQLERQSDQVARRHRARDLPLCLDLLAACWSAGVVPRDAALTVAVAIGGPMASALNNVALRLDVGSAPEDAWRFLIHELDDDGARDAYRALVSASSSGVAPVKALNRAATRSREMRRRSGEAAARTVAVRVAAPLGLCFLPAFVLLAIAPAVLGAIGPVTG